jgi:MFS family permease
MSAGVPLPSAKRPRIPASIWALGVVSLFTDLGSELVHSLLPLYLAGALGASALAIGLIEGAAEALALVVKAFSGYVSDLVRRRKPLVVLGYALAALSKPLFPLASGAGDVLGARLLDRLGKGIRGAPRDALMADLAPKEIRGAAFGLRQSLDTVGAVAGPLAAVALMLAFAGDIQLALWGAVVPGVIAVAILAIGVREPDRTTTPVAARLPISREGLRRLGRGFWMVTAVGGLLALARFTEAFLVLRASSLGIANTWVPVVMAAMAGAYALTAWPAGRWSDTTDRRVVLATGMGLLAVADLVLATAASVPMLGLGVLVWGAHLGLTQAVLSTLVADQAPAELRGTAFGAFNLVQGAALLVASGGAGWLWDHYGAAAPFWAGAALALVGVLAVSLLRAQGPGQRAQ